ncbi:hypothetical protein PEC18_07340 [Paucibacter sp. O1-1]|nr:hypothetical protein [Paucibacter sp. O1-1]MDA3825684.1 hypothetical protein [Paucibacter sp. O1-1]
MRGHATINGKKQSRYLLLSIAVAFSTFLPLTSKAASPLSCDNEPPPSRDLVTLPPQFESAVKVPASALTTFSSNDVREFMVAAASRKASLLILMREGRPTPIARISAAAPKQARRLEWFQPATATPLSAAELKLTVLENLYAFLLRQDPRDVFSIEDVRAAGPQRTHGRLTHSATLQRIAGMRACAVSELHGLQPEAHVIPWTTARLQSLPSSGAHGLSVSVRVRNSVGERLSTGHLTFGRGDHLACAAEVKADGVGRCTLFDPHGHDLHDHEHRGNTYVTFSGVVSNDRIVLPTTMVYGAGSRDRDSHR